MTEYVARFTELAHFADDYVATDAAKVKRFKSGLSLSIWGRIVGLYLQDMDSMVGTALTIEREMEDARSTRDAGTSGKRKESQYSSSSGKKKRFLVHMGSRAATVTPRIPVRPDWRIRTGFRDSRLRNGTFFFFKQNQPVPVGMAHTL